MGSEGYISHKQSAAALSRMSWEGLTAFRENLSQKKRFGRGGHYLGEIEGRVEREIRRREKSGDPDNARESQGTATIEINGYSVRYAHLNETESPKARGIFIGAHPDDHIMAGGIDGSLVRQGVALTIVSLTGGEECNLPGVSAEEKREIRWSEDKDSALIIGGTLPNGSSLSAKNIYNPFLPDGALSMNKKAAVAVVRGIAEIEKPDFVIVPHYSDPHDDHAVIYEFVKDADLPLYVTDTISGEDKLGSAIDPTHFVPHTSAEHQVWLDTYSVYDSQVNPNRIVPEDVPATRDVMRMTKRRGKEVGEEHVGVLIFDGKFRNQKDHIADLLPHAVVM